MPHPVHLRHAHGMWLRLDLRPEPSAPAWGVTLRVPRAAGGGAFDAMTSAPPTILCGRSSTPAGLVLDEGLATELERQGFDLAHSLCSTRLLRARPKAIGSCTGPT